MKINVHRQTHKKRPVNDKECLIKYNQDPASSSQEFRIEEELNEI